MLTGSLASAQATPKTPACTHKRHKPCHGKHRRHLKIGQRVALTPPSRKPSANPLTGTPPSSGASSVSPQPPLGPPPPEEPPEEPPWEQPPEEPPSACTDTVSTLLAAVNAILTAEGGAVVCLADGSYVEANLSASPLAGRVTLRAEHPGQATIAGASLDGSNLTLERFVITNEVQVQPGSTGITVAHNRITGGGEGIDACPSTTTTCDDVKIIGNQFVGPFGEDAIHLNRYHDADGDGIGVLIEGNEISGVRENGSHSDCLETVWVGDHLVFRGNYLHDNRCQGFFVKDQATPVVGIKVEDNLFLRNKEPCGPPLGPTECGQPNYFQVFGPYEGLTMRRNTIWGDDADSIASFREGAGPNTVISRNVIYRLWTDTDMSGVSLRENTLCEREGSWPSSTPGETIACSLSFLNTAKDDYRLSGSNRGVDWAPAEVHFGP
jgi:hypothetical protein